MISTLIGLMVLVAAVSIGGLEYAMGPNQRRFPCVNKFTIWVLRIYAVSLAGSAFDRLYHALYVGDPLPWTPFQVNASFWLMLSHAVMYYAVLKLRLPEGVWPYLQIRVSRAKRAAKIGGEPGAVLARAAARPRDRAESASIASTGLYQTPKGWDSVLHKLLSLP